MLVESMAAIKDAKELVQSPVFYLTLFPIHQSAHHETFNRPSAPCYRRSFGASG